ncbi:MAG: hypothetical protein JSR98_13715 [Proteobacteria bacterium]|nr:hypothetical protein [Pseudomonadota bacterium]
MVRSEPAVTVADRPWRKRFRLFFVVVATVLALSALKVGIHWTRLEFLTLNALFTSAIAAAVFIIGFLLSSVLADYKEAERMPADLRVALESVYDDSRVFAARSDFDAGPLQAILVGVVEDLHASLDRKGDPDLKPAIARVDEITDQISALEAAGMAPNYIVRLRAEQGVMRRCLFRIYHIQRIQFVPSVHVLVQTIVLATVTLLLFLKTEGSPESALIFGAIAYMFTYALHLVNTLEQPFRRNHRSLDDVSLFLLREFADKVRARNGSPLVETSAQDVHGR